MNEIVIYETNDTEAQIEIQFEQDTFWLTQQQIADLFGTKRPAIKNILAKYLIPANWMKKWLVPFWNIPLF